MAPFYAWKSSRAPACGQAADHELNAALEGLKNRGVIAAEQAEEAKRRIAKEGGEA